MSGAGPSIVAVLLNYRTADMTLSAAEATRKALAGLDATLLIVDNASGDGSFEKISAVVQKRKWKATYVIQSGRNGGFGAGNNVGIREALARHDPDYFYIQNSDAFPEKDAIAKLVVALEADPRAGFACSKLHREDGENSITAFNFPSILGELEGGARFGPLSRLLHRSRIPIDLPTSTTPVGWSAGASMMIRRATLDEVGLFDETFFLYFEETELCLRAKRAGWHCLFVPSSEVCHLGSVSTGMQRWTRVPGYWFASQAYYYVKMHGRFYAVLALSARWLGCSFSALRARLTGRPAPDPEHFRSDLARSLGRLLVHAAPVRTSPSQPQPKPQRQT